VNNTIPATSYDKEPQFNFAVFSLRDGCKVAELESSAESERYMRRLFNVYKTWGLPDVTFYFVDWAAIKIIDTFKATAE